MLMGNMIIHNPTIGLLNLEPYSTRLCTFCLSSETGPMQWPFQHLFGTCDRSVRLALHLNCLFKKHTQRECRKLGIPKHFPINGSPINGLLYLNGNTHFFGVPMDILFASFSIFAPLFFCLIICLITVFDFEFT